MKIGWDAKPMKIFFHRIERHGIFDVNLIYKEIKEWFAENNYTYVEKENTTNKKDKGVEIKITMLADRDVTDYFKFAIEIKYLIVETQKVKVKDKLLDRGYFRAFFKAELVLDHKHLWAKNRLSKLLRFIYNNFIIKNKIDDVYSPALKFEADDAFNTMKEALDMYNQ